MNTVATDAGESVKPGDSITYIINYENSGIRTVDELRIIARVPENTQFLKANKKVDIRQDKKELTFVVDQNIRRGEKGSVSFTVEVDKPLDNGVLVVLDKVLFDYKIKNKSYSEAIEANLSCKVTSSPKFDSFSVEAVDENGGYLRRGDVVDYIIRFKNTGDMNATGVNVKTTLTDNVTIIRESITNNGEVLNDEIMWQIGDLVVNKPYYLSFKVKVKDNLADGEAIINVALLSCNQEVNEEKSVESKVKLFPDFSTSEVFLYDLNGGYLWAGETIRAKVVLRNTGEKVAESYKLICPIPNGVTYISKSGTPEGIRWSDEIRGLVWDLENLEVGQEKEITFDMRVNDDLLYKGGNISTNFKIQSEDNEIDIPSKSIAVKKRVNMTIVAMGDSLIAYSNWVQEFDNLLESTYPYADYNTIASGVPGEMAFQGARRFDSSVAPYHPSIIIIAYGTNDAGGSLSRFASNLEELVIKSRKLGATVFLNLIGPLVGPKWTGKQSYPEYNNAIRQIGSKYGIPVIDVLTPLSQDPGRYLSDGCHYTPEGASVVAQTVFSAVRQYLDDIGDRRR
ncbi:MAG: DUF11 domain-containing protein [Actinobacteria bacterium]|nr:DUF11 domain-containing protein [Actinomycetota bacterium]